MSKLSITYRPDKYDLNTIELNAILYYADFLSLKSISKPVTDTCKYFFIYGTPINSAFIAEVKPIYDENNEFLKQSREEYYVLRERFGDDGVMSFLDNICNLGVAGSVSARDMLRCIHRFSTRGERNKAIKKYEEWKKSLTYKHYIKDDEGKSKLVECSKEVAHVDQARGFSIESNVLESSRIN